MINNRQQQQAGRRRGRGGQQQRPQGGGNGPRDNGNRIDNRARGNASQLHEKYKTLAADSQRQGDRVTTEYYLQFADHYFRVLSESRSRFEEQRRPQDDEQSEQDGDDYGDEGEIVRASDQPMAHTGNEPRRVRDGNREQAGRDQNGRNQNGRDQNNRDQNAREQDGGNRDYGNRDNGRDGARDGGRENGNRDGGNREARGGNRDNTYRDNGNGDGGNREARDYGNREGGNRDTVNRESAREREDRRPRTPRVETAGSGEAPPRETQREEASFDAAPREIAPTMAVESPQDVTAETEAPAPRRRGRPRREVAVDAEAPVGFEADRLPPSLGISAIVPAEAAPTDAATADPGSADEVKPRRRRVRATPEASAAE